MANKVGQEDVRSSDVSSGPAANLLSRILDFLFDRFKILPPSLRAVAYFVFLAFFCATAWRLVAGQYVVRGVVWDGDDYATSCEIRLRGDYFSTNSKGMFYAILSPAQYYRFATLGKVDLPVMCRQQDGRFKRMKGPFTVAMSLWDDEFDEIHLDAPMQRADSPLSFSLIPSAYAAEDPAQAQKPLAQSQAAPQLAAPPPSSPGDRLVIDRILRGKLAENMRDVEIEIKLGKKERPLLLQGVQAGELRLKSKVNLGSKYYFDVSQVDRGARATIEMEASGFFGNEERFKLRVPTGYNEPMIVKGSQGSTLILRLMPRAAEASPSE